METAAPVSPEIWGKTGFKKSLSLFQAGRAAELCGEERSLRVTGSWKKSWCPPQAHCCPHQFLNPLPRRGEPGSPWFSLCISCCPKERPASFPTYCADSSHHLPVISPPSPSPSLPGGAEHCPLSQKCSSVPRSLKGHSSPFSHTVKMPPRQLPASVHCPPFQPWGQKETGVGTLAGS